MSFVLTLVAESGSGRLNDGAADAVRTRANLAGFAFGPPRWLNKGEACDLPLGNIDPEPVRIWSDQALGDFQLDIGVTATEGRRKKFLIADMDATIVVGETIDALAARAGSGDQVTEITAQAMAGELDFKDALRQRVATLKGLDAGVIDEVLGELEITQGAATLVATMAKHGAATMLVSGGFTPFVSHVANKLGFEFSQANRLEIEDAKLTGRVVEPILDRDAKLAALHDLADRVGLTPQDGLAVGDGANDLDMIAAAGLGAAWRAKPVLRERADLKIDHGDLTALLYFQGYRARDFVRQDLS
ncbi:MAG: phosphoserine phosphatase SerB [Alphaproteobacteria bacterium]|nr:phosphoserine phosphatase SerB [Alphaproteobacteria bacterium]